MASGVRNFKYVVTSENVRCVVCPKAWEVAHGISRYYRKELTRDVNGVSDIVRFRSKGTKADEATKKRVYAMFQSDQLMGFDTNHILSMGMLASTERAQSV